MLQNVLTGAREIKGTVGTETPLVSLVQEVEILKEELRETKGILEAIRSGAADALVVSRDGREMVYTLENADKPFRVFLEEMQEGAVTVDQSGLIVYANRRFAQVLGQPLESVMGSLFQVHVCTADQAAVQQFLRNEAGQAEKIEVSLRAGHQLVPVFLTASPFQIGDRPSEKLLCLVVTDLSPQRKVEAAAAIDREWKNRYDAVVRASGHLMYDWNPRTGAVLFGGDIERLLGYSLSDMAGGRERWEQLVHPDDLAAFRAECSRSVAARSPFGLEYRVRHRDGAFLWFQDNGYPLMDATGDVASIVGFRMDITGRKAAEEKIQLMNTDLERRVRERTSELEFANKEMEAFCYSISHDLRAPLRSIRGFSELVLETCGAKVDDRSATFLKRACESAVHMNQLLDDLLRLSVISRGELQREEADLGDLARKIISELQAANPERRIEFKAAPRLIARGDLRLLRIALDNLLSNAWKFTGKKSDGAIEFGSDVQDGRRVFFVRDNGDGFDMGWKHKLFGVFERLHSAKDFPGTGIGLAIVQRIILRHGGSIWAEGKIGEGATFYFTLPE